MTRDEWAGVALIMDKCWKGTLDDTTEAAYHTMLKSHVAEDVMAALYRLAENGSPFLPAVPELIAEVRRGQEPPLPAWSEVWDSLLRAARKRSRDEAIAYLHDQGLDLVVAFMEVDGWKRFRETPFNDPDYGAIRQAEFKARWEEWLEHQTDRARSGHALEAMTGQRRGVPTRLGKESLLGHVRRRAALTERAGS